MTRTAAGRAPVRKGGARRTALIAAAMAGLALLGLSACSPGPGTITVQGTVLDIAENPVPNTGVLVNGTLTSTASDGSFTVSDVSTPYDVAIYLDPSVSPSGNPVAIVYRGLTLARPKLGVLAEVGPYYSDQVSGTIGSALTTQKGLLLAGGPSYSDGVLQLDSTDTSGGAFGPLTVYWGAGTSRPTTLFTLAADVDTNTGLPTTYTGYAATSLTLSASVDQTGVDDTLSNQGLSTLPETGTVIAPSGYTLTNDPNCGQPSYPACREVGSMLMLRFTKGATGAAFGLAAGVTSANVPQDGAGTIGYALLARAEPSGATSDDAYSAAVAAAPNVGPSTSNTLTLPAPPNPLTPANGATGVTAGTSFQWEALADSIYAVSLAPSSGSSTDPQIILLTAGTQATLPDLSKLGIQLPPQAQYAYSVTAVGPFATVDAAANRPLLFLEAQVIMNNLFGAIAGGSGGPFPVPYPVPDLRLAQAPKVVVTTQ